MQSTTVAAALATILAMGWGVACDRRRQPQPLPAASAAPATSASARAATPACPDGMALVDSFCIDRYEAQLVEYAAPERTHSPYERPDPERKYRAQSTPGVVPQAYISRFEAEQACAHSGKRLCRAREWLKACVGPADTTYPYGASQEAGRCNTGKPHILPQLFGKRTKLTPGMHYNNPRVNQEPGFLAKTGEYAGCRTATGIHDLVGNLHEWVSDSVGTLADQNFPMPYGEQRMGGRGAAAFVGGYYSSNGDHGEGCRYITTSHRPAYHDYSIGFRCCADVAASVSVPPAPK